MDHQSNIDFTAGFSCPIPITDYPAVLLAHGGGGKLSQQLIRSMFFSQFDNPALREEHDGAMISLGGARLAFSTDSYVVHPIFFPGGNIGELAVYGTVNDLAMCGATPYFLSAAFIIEEGFPMERLWTIVQSMQQAAARSSIQLVTGDTKVVDRGKGDEIFITTSGIGLIEEGISIAPRRAAVGDTIILSGYIAEHGIAIMSVREGIAFETQIQSDCAPLNGLVDKILKKSKNIHVLRDPTRGGLASSLNEIADAAHIGIVIEEMKIPVTEEVQGACEILGLDPLYIANEGKLIAIVPDDEAGNVLSVMRSHPNGREATVIGKVVDAHPGIVVMKTTVGGNRVVDMLSGEQLPRIC
ncbi:MAG: hydrogenase expression/formation protein HypE [Bacteroidota bacterium]